MRASSVPAVTCKPLKTFSLAGCLLGSSSVLPVVCKPLKTLASPVLAGPFPISPIPPSPGGRARALPGAAAEGEDRRLQLTNVQCANPGAK
jgi:hypothetical protein